MRFRIGRTSTSDPCGVHAARRRKFSNRDDLDGNRFDLEHARNESRQRCVAALQNARSQDRFHAHARDRHTESRGTAADRAPHVAAAAETGGGEDEAKPRSLAGFSGLVPGRGRTRRCPRPRLGVLVAMGMGVVRIGIRGGGRALWARRFRMDGSWRPGKAKTFRHFTGQ